MFFVLSKVLIFLLMPLTWIILTLLLGMLIRKDKFKKIFLWASVFLIILFTNPLITNTITKAWEIDPIPLQELQKHDVAIILSGVTSDQPPRDRTNYTRGADRVLHPVLLYKTNKIVKILITGGSGLLSNEKNDVEAENIKKTLLLAGIPEHAIEVEGKARNTHENAVFSAEILNSKYPDQKYLLVTSAYHMRRSLACFRKEGLEVTPFTVEFFSDKRGLSADKFIPNIDSLVVWHILFKEWFGMITYKISGYI